MRIVNAIGKRFSRALLNSERRYQLGYAIPISQEMHNSIRGIQLDLLRENGADIAIESNLHITLKQGFEILDLIPFEQHFDQLVSSTEPFDVRVQGFGFFDEGIVYMDVVQTNALKALRERILRDLSTKFGVNPNPIEDDRYHFHASVAHTFSAPCFERSQRAVRGRDLNFEFTCGALELLLYTGQEWIAYKRSTLLPGRD